MVVVLLALLLGGCGIRIETGGGTPPAPATASRAPTSSDGSAVSVADTRVERAPAPDTRADDERTAVQEAEKLFMRRIELVPRKEYHLEQFDLQGR